jgi:hypothetical protein
MLKWYNLIEEIGNMKAEKTSRGFTEIKHEKYQNEPGVMTRLIQESSAIDDKGYFGYLWVGQDHHLNRKEVTKLINHMLYWLKHGKLKIEKMKTKNSIKYSEAITFNLLSGMSDLDLENLLEVRGLSKDFYNTRNKMLCGLMGNLYGVYGLSDITTEKLNKLFNEN